MTEFLFVYGTLTDPTIQRRVFGRTAPGTPGKLPGYQKDVIYLGNRIYPIIKPQAESVVTGLVIRVTPNELIIIDQYEGNAYQRQKARLVSGQEVWVYAEPGGSD